MKKALSLLVCLCVGLNLIFPVSAQQNSNSALSKFKSFVEPIYKDETYRFSVIDDNDSNVTEIFLDYTTPLYSANDWESIFNYALSNSLNIRKFEDEIQLYSGDIGRTYSEYCVEDVYIIEVNGNKDNGYLVGTLGGTIYYNPNTGAVSYVSNVKYSDVEITYLVYSNIVSETPSSSIGDHCGIFKVTCTATARSNLIIDVPVYMASNNSTTLVLQLKIYPEL